MKKLLAAIAALSLLAPNASAAISVKKMVQYAQVDSAASGIALSSNQVMVFGNREKNGFAQIANGVTIELSCSIESFVSAATADSEGNFYLVGAAANPIVGTLPPITDVLNPDNVVSDPISSNKSDATTLCLWKLDSTGKIIESSTMDISSVVIPYSILVDKFGVTIAGTTFTDPGFKAIILDWNAKPIYIGKSSTRIFSITRTTDGGTVAVGQSSEKLLDKSLRGKADGFLAKVLNGKLVSVQRSSDINSTRAWRSSTNNLLLGGNSNSTAVITKFANNFTPTWTDRYPSNGSALTANVAKVNYGAFYSTGSFKALPTWKKKNTILLLTFNEKGVILGANYVEAPKLTKLNGLAANSAFGPMILASGFIYRA